MSARDTAQRPATGDKEKSKGSSMNAFKALAGLVVLVVLVLFPFTSSVSQKIGKYDSATRMHVDDGGPARVHMAERLEAESGLPYHNGDTVFCSDCHTLHASMQHNYAGNTSAEGNISSFPWSTTPTPYLLKANDPVDLCLTCHDNMTGVPDVVGMDVNALSERSAGYFDQPDEINPRGHDLGRALPMGGGFGLCSRCHFGGDSDKKVTCIDCHNPHGNGNPRNLQWASDPPATPPVALFNPTGTVGLTKYENVNTTYGTLNTTVLREVTTICVDCHHTLTGPSYNDPDGNDIHSLHPSYESERGDPNAITDGVVRGTTNPLHWNDGTGSGFIGTDRVPFVVSGATDFASGQVIDASTNGVFCLSCHKAHGSPSAFGLVWEVTGQVERKGCDQCHAMEPLP